VERVLLDREGVRIDVELYRAVWGLQRVFSDPLRVLRPGSDYPWGKVKTDLGAVLKAFEGTPLGGGGEETRANVDDTHAAKYLTSCKLFKLQMRDAVFRRHFLLQALIVLQCLQGPRRDVTATRDANLGKEARAEIDGLRRRVLRAVEASGEGGAPFAEFLRRLQEREALWVKWKIASCPPIDKAPIPRTEAADRADAGELPAALKAVGKRKRDAELERARKPRPMYFLPPGVEPVSLGHPDLDRLWNLSSDNASCLDFEDQATVPTLQDLMRPVVAQADPEEGVAGEDKVQNDKVFCWKALRQMARVDVAAFSKAGTSTLEAAIPALFPEDGRRLLEAGAVLGPEPLPEAGGQGSPMRESPPAEKLQGKHTRFSSPQKEGGADGEAEGPPVGDTDGSGSPMRDDDSQEARGKHMRFTSPVKGEVGPSDPEEGGVPGTE
jgi:THO complex subunit 1